MEKLIIVTGGSGYIGKTIIAMLLEFDYKVINIDIKKFDTNDLNKPEVDINFDKINEILYQSEIDLSYDLSQYDLDEMRPFIKDSMPYALIHMASWKDLPGSFENQYEYYRNNIKSTLNAIDLAHRMNVKKFIFSSSAAVYSDMVLNGVTEDNYNINPSSPYGKTKLFSESIVSESCSTLGITPIILRYYNPIGTYKGISIDLSDSMFGALINSIKINKAFTIFGGNYNTKDGTPIRDYVDLTDVARAHLHFIDYNIDTEFDPVIYNVGSGIGTSCKEACDIVKSLLPKFKFIISARRKGDSAGCFADIDRLNGTGFEVSMGITDSIKNLLRYSGIDFEDSSSDDTKEVEQSQYNSEENSKIDINTESFGLLDDLPF